MCSLSVTCRLWVMIILVLGKGWWCLGCLEKERIALLQLKANINYPNNGISLPSWVDHEEETADCCGWEGVVCSSSSSNTTTTTKRVVGLRLSFDGADWYFNASLFLPFEELRTLNLSDNSISGWVENEGFERLSRLSALEVLDLSDNLFDNSVLSSLSGLSSLKYLYLQRNLLQGPTQPTRLHDFISLKVLDLTGNGMEIFGPIQGFNGSSSLSNLEVLKLSANNFNNNILPSVSGLSNLKFLDLSLNQLKGQIHIKELRTLSNLENLDLSSNEIENLVNPEGIKSLSKVKVLHLTDITGPITIEGIRNLSNLEDLFVDYSSNGKDFLRSIGEISSLKVLSLAHSSINGTLPDQGWCELKNLEELDISGNQLEGNLPQCLGNLTSLRVFDFANNQITGNIASSPLSALSSLEYLSLSNNLLEVPSSFWSIANYSHLKVLLCSGNRLTVEPTLNSWSPKFQLNIFAFSNWTLDHLNVATPNFLHNQYDLRVVDLSHNNLNGTFPNWLLENNTRLEELYLSHNSFEGSFKLPSRPNPSIRTIDINKNQIGGHIPANISSIFPNLQILSMSSNALEGNLASRFSDMKFLWALDLSNNNLSGEMPEHFAVHCPSLLFLKLSNNKLGGQLSPAALNLSRLQYLHIDGNKLVGKIPDSLSTLSLLALNVSSNEFSGELPRWIGNMTNIAEIEMSKNHFQGPIPEELCKLNIITYLDLSENNLSGSLPSCFNPLKVRHLHLYRNKLEGPILAHGFYDSSYLVTLDLRDNHFSGSIPIWFGNVSGLSILLLKSNYFKGEIPIQLCHKSKMSIMDLSQNLLHGPIPRCLGNITTEARNNIRFTYPNPYISSYPVRSFVESYMDLTVWVHELSFSDLGEKVEFVTKNNSYAYKGNILNYMSGIDLSCNQLTGEIPFGLGNLSKIKALNLSHNHLTGSIPTTFSNLRNIESLDLSYNNLSGEIPSELTKLTTLAVFSVAFNNLSGMIPRPVDQFGTFEESCYKGNPFLCGLPLHNNCSGTGLSQHEVEDTGFIDMGVFYVSFAASYITVLLGIIAVLYINPHWRQAWFYVIEVCITTSYYFAVDNFPKLFKFRNM